ncbi:MAG: cysteine--tRNA ligase [Eubacteriales bacterium]|nr:cysteine--tRNA ligase [Eubacteriales bacterium]
MRIYNDLSRKKEELIPQVPGEYKIYVCGPTVYDFFHLGNARPFIVYDTLRRYLEYRGNKVIYVQNFTDIDDKVIRRAHEEGIDYKELTDRMIKEYFTDAGGLNVKPATSHPRATECMDDIIDMIKILYDKGYAYVIEGDGVYFETAKFPDYGKLSHRDQEESEHESRVAHNADKRSESDFVLWKFKKPGEPAWPSPWGEGRPGWHIECSAMNKRFLGLTVDIHGGGQDLIFPHHENEIAQSEAANGAPFVRYWMHNGFVNVDNEKMAKSVGNFFTVRDLAQRYPYAVIRFFMLQAHYRMPINFTAELLEAAHNGWQRLVNFAGNLSYRLSQPQADDAKAPGQVKELIAETRKSFREAMDDDLNTADAFGAIFSFVREFNTLLAGHKLAREDLQAGLDLLAELLDVLGLDPLVEETEEIPEEVKELAAKRQEAKAAKNWPEADRLRDEITKKGYKLEDTAEGSRLVKL